MATTKGSEVRKIRKDLGLTQAEMANALRVGYSTYRSWEQSYTLTERQSNSYSARLKVMQLENGYE